MGRGQFLRRVADWTDKPAKIKTGELELIFDMPGLMQLAGTGWGWLVGGEFDEIM